MQSILPRERVGGQERTRRAAVEIQSSTRRSLLVPIEFNSDRTSELVGGGESSTNRSPLIQAAFNIGRAARLVEDNEEVCPWRHATRC